jgi:anti-anti-sigma regulatory factor
MNARAIRNTAPRRFRRRFGRPARGYRHRVHTVRNRGASASASTAQETSLVSGLGGSGAVAARIESRTNAGAGHVIVDFGSADTIDAATLTTLHRHARSLRAGGKQLSVVCEHPSISSLLHLTLLDRSFDVFPSRDEALLTRP